MARTRYYPPADVKAQDFSRRYPGDIMSHPNVCVLHTTEGSSWPGYDGGAMAPQLTLNPRGADWRQHFPVDMSGRALAHPRGTIATNTLNVVQVELIGTCTLGGPGFYWPGATDDELELVARFLAWLSKEWPVPLKDAAPRGWVAYPASYGLRARQRMTAAEWLNAQGVLAHQHVVNNEHGDAGAFPIARTLELAQRIVTPPKVTPKPTPKPKPDPAPKPVPKPTTPPAPRDPVWDAPVSISDAVRKQYGYGSDRASAHSLLLGADAHGREATVVAREAVARLEVVEAKLDRVLAALPTPSTPEG